MRVKFFLVLVCAGMSACGGPTKPEVHYSSENSISLKYHAFAMRPTVSGEAIDMAIKHCQKHGKGMKLVSSEPLDGITTRELHTFMCTNDFTDKRIEVNVN